MGKMPAPILFIKLALRHDRYGNHAISDKMERLASEYWITDGGDILYADGDVGDFNHQAYVVDQILHSHDINPEIVDVESLTDEELKDKGLSDVEVDIVRCTMDGREYAVEKWGWIRVMGNNADVKTINNNIVSDLLDCWYEEYGDNIENQTFNIYHIDRNTMYYDIPYNVLDDISTGNKGVSALLPYRDF